MDPATDGAAKEDRLRDIMEHKAVDEIRRPFHEDAPSQVLQADGWHIRHPTTGESCQWAQNHQAGPCHLFQIVLGSSYLENCEQPTQSVIIASRETTKSEMIKSMLNET